MLDFIVPPTTIPVPLSSSSVHSCVPSISIIIFIVPISVGSSPEWILVSALPSSTITPSLISLSTQTWSQLTGINIWPDDVQLQRSPTATGPGGIIPNIWPHMVLTDCSP